MGLEETINFYIRYEHTQQINTFMQIEFRGQKYKVVTINPNETKKDFTLITIKLTEYQKSYQLLNTRFKFSNLKNTGFFQKNKSSQFRHILFSIENISFFIGCFKFILFFYSR